MTLTKKARGTLWIIAAIIVALPILLILLLLLRLDSVVKAGVEYGGQQALHVETRLQSASVSILGQTLSLMGLAVENPKGFKSPDFFKADLIRVAGDVGVLRKKELHLREVTLAAPEFTCEYADGKWNINVLMDNLKSEQKAPKPADEKGQPMKLKIDRFTISNAKVHVIVKGNPIEASLGTVVITDIADANGNAIPMDEVLGVVLKRVAGNIVNLPGIPDAKGILSDLKKQAGNTGEEIKKAGEGIGGEIKKIFGK